ncbi:hypothetical protein TK45_02935 [Bowmanella sp. JS7-9]|nr:hypothetical protein TK45_02935 [Bowmanella sp. JS7-9]
MLVGLLVICVQHILAEERIKSELFVTFFLNIRKLNEECWFCQSPIKQEYAIGFRSRWSMQIKE